MKCARQRCQVFPPGAPPPRAASVPRECPRSPVSHRLGSVPPAPAGSPSILHRPRWSPQDPGDALTHPLASGIRPVRSSPAALAPHAPTWLKQPVQEVAPLYGRKGWRGRSSPPACPSGVPGTVAVVPPSGLRAPHGLSTSAPIKIPTIALTISPRRSVSALSSGLHNQAQPATVSLTNV